jgi:hypothetical protein
VNDSTYEESVVSQSELGRVEKEQVREEAMSTGSGLRNDTQRDVSRNASERDEAVIYFNQDLQKMFMIQEWVMMKVNRTNKEKDIEGIA